MKVENDASREKQNLREKIYREIATNNVVYLLSFLDDQLTTVINVLSLTLMNKSE